MLLGRTFKEKSLEEASGYLADVLGMDDFEALQKAASAKGATTAVIHTFTNCGQACDKAEELRRKGLRVQVASELGLPGFIAPIKPEGEPPSSSPLTRRSSCPNPKGTQPVRHLRPISIRRASFTKAHTFNGSVSTPESPTSPASLRRKSWTKRTSYEEMFDEVNEGIARKSLVKRRSSLSVIPSDPFDAEKDMTPQLTPTTMDGECSPIDYASDSDDCVGSDHGD